MNEFITPDARTLTPTPQQAVLQLLGIPIEQLILDIQENAGGKYDSLYRDPVQTEVRNG